MTPETSEGARKGAPGVLLPCEPGLYNRNGLETQRESLEYPDAAAWKWSDTSRDAAEAINAKLGRLQRLALEAIRNRGPRGLTAEELAAELGVDRPSAQPRTSELRRKGLVVDSGLRRRNGSSGKSAICWVTPEHKRGEA